MISTDQLYVVQLTHKVKKENIVNTALFIFSPAHFLDDRRISPECGSFILLSSIIVDFFPHCANI